MFTFILNLNFIDTTSQVKHLMIGHVLDGAFLYRLTVVGFFFLSSNLDGSNGLLLLANFLCSYLFGKDPNPDTARSVGVNAKERETREKNEEKGLRHGK